MNRHPIIDARADRARKAIKAGDYECPEDLITDILHLCEVEKIDGSEIVERAVEQHESETGDGDDIEQDVRRMFEETGKL